MAPGVLTGRTRPTKIKKQQRALKRKRDDVDVDKLAQAVADLDPKTTAAKQFADLPLSEPTKAGLKAAHFVDLTDIQAKAIPVALKGGDILGAAKTGSGKTLAFIVPVLENLYRAQCIGSDAGLGAMIISPTRELAIQLFDVLYQIGRKGHMFAAGLIIGGKSLQEEQDALVRMNIVVCTPGRMLQHLSQTAAFSVDNLQMLVLDEADRIMDLGFQRDVDAIVDYLPKERQTLLFSATQTRKVSDLARLSLKEPLYISVHEGADKATPKKLQQNYILTPLHEKLDTLWSFLQSSKKAKIIVFLSSGKQVRFIYEAFRKMQPGIPLLHLHGRQKQAARLEINRRFADAKYSCLFATDVAARGLDFPAVDWVVQVDCPEDGDTYIHRVGRTARYQSEGRAVLFLDPSEEEGMLKRLEQKKVPIERINVKQKKKQTITNQMANLCFKDPALKYLGQKAFASYARSIQLQKDKEIFTLAELPLEEYATSLGLPGAPRIKFLKGDNAKNLKNASRQAVSSSEEESEAELDQEGPTRPSSKAKKQELVRTKYDRMFERQNQDVLSSHYSKIVQDEDLSDAGPPPSRNQQTNFTSDDQDEEGDTFLSVKRIIPLDETLPDGPDIPDLRPKKLVHLQGASDPLLIDSKRAEKRLKSKKQLLRFKDRGERLVFDDDGVAHPLYEMVDEEDFRAEGVPEVQRERFVEKERERVREADAGDKAVAKEKKRAKKDKKKERERREALGDVEGEGEDEEGVGRDLYADFVADADGVVSDSADESRAPAKEAKRPKKWFEDSSDEDGVTTGKKKKRTKARAKGAVEAPETLEDLEALAAGLLEG